MKKTDTFSAHTLKLLDTDPLEFKKRYVDGLYFIENRADTKQGKKFHALISYYLKGYDIQKFENTLDTSEMAVWQALKSDPVMQQKEYVALEHSFLVKEENFFLTGRFDAIFKDDKGYTVMDWKMKNLPHNPENDLQSVVYLHCASKIFNTQNIKMTYFSLLTREDVTVHFKEGCLKRIEDVITKQVWL